MSAFRVRKVQPWTGNQMILWLEDEHSKADGPGDGTQYCVRITIDECRELLPAIMDAYAATMQNIAMELACGGCRTCDNTRRVGRNLLAGVPGDPCPVCVPRGEKRLRSMVHLQPKENR